MPLLMSGGINTAGRFVQAFQEYYTNANWQKRGDKLFPRHLEKLGLERLVDMGIEPITKLGESKLVSMAEFYTKRRTRIARDRLYFNNEPPTEYLDKEDPAKEMMRIFPPIARKIVRKGAEFLFGKERFNGVDSFNFENANAEFQKQFEQFWKKEKMNTKMKRISRTALWASDCPLKIHADVETETFIQIPADKQKDPEAKERRKVEFGVSIADPQHFHAISEEDNPKNVLVWIHQFKRVDQTFFREEIYKDMTLVYEGRMKETLSKTKETKITPIQGSGMQVEKIETKTEFVEFTLVKILHYEDLDEFPLVMFRNEPDNDLYGTSIYHGMHGKFDALVDIFTRTFHALQNQATPLLWAKGVKQSNTPDHNVHSSDAFWCFPDKDAALNVLQWEGTPTAVFDYIKLLKDEIQENAGTPKTNTLEAFTNVSGEALTVINSDVVDTTNDRRLDYECAFEDLVRIFRKLHGHVKPIEDNMSIKWGPVFPESKEKTDERLLAFNRAKIVRRAYVIKRSPLIPNHEKDELAKVAEEMETADEKLKQEAIAAQAKRVGQRAGGTTPERGKGQKGNETK